MERIAMSQTGPGLAGLVEARQERTGGAKGGAREDRSSATGGWGGCWWNWRKKGTRWVVHGVRGQAFERADRRSDSRGARMEGSHTPECNCNGSRSIAPIEADFVTLAARISRAVSPFSIITKRSSPSRVRFAAPAGRALDSSGPLWSLYLEGETA